MMSKTDAEITGPIAGEILILTGTPGSGKTTIAKMLCERPAVPKVHLHADDFWHFIRYGAVAPYLPEANEQNAVVIDVLAKTAEGYAKGGYFVVVDGIIGPWFLKPFESLDAQVHYLVLSPPLELAIKRCQQRGGNTLTDAGVITSLHQQLSDLQEMEKYVLFTDECEPSEILDQIAERVRSRELLLM